MFRRGRAQTEAVHRSAIDATAERIRDRGLVIASWYASEPHVLVGGTDCTLLLRGNTSQMKTYLFSRIVRGLLLQNWEVAAFFYDDKASGGLLPDNLSHTEQAVWNYMSHQGIRWSWLYFVTERSIPPPAAKYAREHRRKEIGVVLVDTIHRQIEFARDMFLARHASKFVRYS